MHIFVFVCRQALSNYASDRRCNRTHVVTTNETLKQSLRVGVININVKVSFGNCWNEQLVVSRPAVCQALDVAVLGRRRLLLARRASGAPAMRHSPGCDRLSAEFQASRHPSDCSLASRCRQHAHRLLSQARRPEVARRRLLGAHHLALHDAVHDAHQLAAARPASEQGERADQGAAPKVGLLARRALAHLSRRPCAHQPITTRNIIINSIKGHDWFFFKSLL